MSPLKAATPTKKKTTTTTAPKKGAAKGGQPDELDALIAAMQRGGGTSTSASELRSALQQAIWNTDVYLGSSSTFTSERRRKGKYMVGGDVRTKVKGSDLLKALGDPKQMSDAKYRELQEKLFKGGYYGTNNRKAIAWGRRHDEDTREAYAKAIATNVLANENTGRNNRISLTEILDQPGPDLTMEGAEEPVFSYQPPDPALLRATLNDAMPSLIGRGLSTGETDQLVTAYLAKAEAAARSAFNVQQSGGVAAPTPDFNAFALGEVERLRPDEFRARRMADLSEQFLANISSETTADRVF